MWAQIAVLERLPEQDRRISLVLRDMGVTRDLSQSASTEGGISNGLAAIEGGICLRASAQATGSALQESSS